jgi:signal transduction histidine kinase
VNKVRFFNRLSTRLAAAFLLASVLGVGLVAFLAYRSSATGLTGFIDSMRGSGCFGGGMMVNQLIAAAQQDYYRRMTAYLWIAGGAGVVLALFLGWLLSRQTVKPLGEIAGAARKVAGGDLEQKVDIKGYSEVSELASSFNHMAETLRHDRELRRNMTADIAHELRTPLAILQGNIEGMQDGVVPVNAETLDSLHAETVELARLVDDLRTLSLAEARQLGFDHRPTDLRELASHVADEFKSRAARQGVEVRVSSPPDLPEVEIDPTRTSQILRNLLDNALRYSPENCRVDVALEAECDGVVLSVTDRGPGIAEEHLPFIFERFYRIDRSRARATGGSGLGLAIAKQLVEAQGGTITADSAAGRGSTFRIYLPYHLKNPK